MLMVLKYSSHASECNEPFCELLLPLRQTMHYYSSLYEKVFSSCQNSVVKV